MNKIFLILLSQFLFLNQLFCQTEQDLKVDFSEIDSLAYLKFKSEFSNHILFDSTISNTSDSLFTLNVNNEQLKFDSEKSSENYYYKGYLKPLDSYIIIYCDLQTCVTFLINKTSGKKDYLIGPYDNQIEPPIISKKLTKILVFSNNVFDDESYIAVYQRPNDTSNFDFESFESIEKYGWDIKEAIWIDESTFALKIIESFKNGSDKISYRTKFIKGHLK